MAKQWKLLCLYIVLMVCISGAGLWYMTSSSQDASDTTEDIVDEFKSSKIAGYNIRFSELCDNVYLDGYDIHVEDMTKPITKSGFLFKPDHIYYPNINEIKVSGLSYIKDYEHRTLVLYLRYNKSTNTSELVKAEVSDESGYIPLNNATVFSFLKYNNKGIGSDSLHEVDDVVY